VTASPTAIKTAFVRTDLSPAQETPAFALLSYTSTQQETTVWTAQPSLEYLTVLTAEWLLVL